MYCWRRYILFFVFCYSSRLYAAPDSSAVPPAVLQQWNALRERDALTDWLYARMAYVEEDVVHRIPVLMRTTADAWRNYHTYPERLAWFDVLALQGYYQLQAGNILASIQAYENALRFYESYPLPDISIIEEVLKPLGNNYTRLADYEMALHIHEKALALVLAGKDASNIAAVYSNMAVCARWKGDLPAAVTFCRSGLQYNNKSDALRGLLLTTYADILSEQGKLDSAQLFCRRALQVLRANLQQEQAAYWYGSALQLAATVALQQQQVQAAGNYAAEAMRWYVKTYPHSKGREKAKLNVLQGNVNMAAGKAQQALLFFQQALLQLLPSWHPATAGELPDEKLLYGENTIGDALEGKAKALRLSGNQEAALQHLFSAFAAQLKLRQQFFYAGSKLREIEVTRERAAMAMQIAYALWQQTKDPKYTIELLRIAELSKAQVLLDERAMREINVRSATDSLSQQILQWQRAITYYRHELQAGAGNEETSKLLQAAEYQLSLLQKQRQPTTAVNNTLLTAAQTGNLYRQLPENAILLEFFEGKDSSFIIEVGKNGIQNVTTILGGQQLHGHIVQFMQHWYGNGAAAMMNAPQQFFRECYLLYATIFKEYQWQTGKRYLLVPDGAFSYLPFDAFLTKEEYSHNYHSWPFLYKQVAMSKAWSLQTWQQQQAGNYSARHFTGFFVAEASKGELPVLAAAEEYRQLQQLVRGSYYIDSAASRAAFAAAITNTGILHVSMHANAGIHPYLQLYDGALFLSDLQYTRFAPALVVLSACQTAGGQLLQGEGVNSLERGFVAAGAGGILSGLWNVNDETAVAFSRLFYQQLPKQPDAALALCQARKEWLELHKNENILQLPYYWAGFTYSGHLQPIKPPQPRKTMLWIVLSGIAAAAIGVMIWKKQRRFPERLI